MNIVFTKYDQNTKQVTIETISDQETDVYFSEMSVHSF